MSSSYRPQYEQYQRDTQDPLTYEAWLEMSLTSAILMRDLLADMHRIVLAYQETMRVHAQLNDMALIVTLTGESIDAIEGALGYKVQS